MKLKINKCYIFLVKSCRDEFTFINWFYQAAEILGDITETYTIYTLQKLTPENKY